MKSVRNLTLLSILVMVMPACAPTPAVNPNASVSSDDTPLPTPTDLPAGEYEQVEVEINSMEAIFLESFPLQVHVIVKGHLPDGCTSIQDSSAKMEENLFILEIAAVREIEAVCTQALVPFEETVPLDVYGLPAGTYHVQSQQKIIEFTFSQDNTLKEGGRGC